MHVRSTHRREVAADPESIWQLIGTLGSDDDRLWCPELWPPDMRIRFDGPLVNGARGGHGTIPYSVESFVSGRELRFRFLPGSGIDGTHGFTTAAGGARKTVVVHHLEGELTRGQIVLWPLIRPFHDAYVEDILDRIEEQAAGSLPNRHRAPRWLRWWNSFDTRRQRRHGSKVKGTRRVVTH